jgi:hypothetical protein
VTQPTSVWIITAHCEWEGFKINSVWLSENLARGAIWVLVEQGVRTNEKEGIYYGITHFHEVDKDGYADVPEGTEFVDESHIDQWYQVREWILSDATLPNEMEA